jgi:hypothetical protein
MTEQKANDYAVAKETEAVAQKKLLISERTKEALEAEIKKS